MSMLSTQSDIRSTNNSYAVRRVLTSKPVESPKVWTAESSPKIEDLFAALREHARQRQISVLELIAEYALDDLPISIAQTIEDYLQDKRPKTRPGEVKFEGLFSSGRSDLSTRIEEIIYDPDPGDDE